MTTRPGPAPGRLKRAGEIRIQVSEELKERFKRVAGLYGLPPSTLAAYALGHWTAHQEASLRVVDTMAETVGGQIGEELKRQFALFDYKGEPKAPEDGKP